MFYILRSISWSIFSFNLMLARFKVIWIANQLCWLRNHLEPLRGLKEGQIKKLFRVLNGTFLSNNSDLFHSVVKLRKYFIALYIRVFWNNVFFCLFVFQHSTDRVLNVTWVREVIKAIHYCIPQEGGSYDCFGRLQYGQTQKGSWSLDLDGIRMNIIGIVTAIVNHLYTVICIHLKY